MRFIRFLLLSVFALFFVSTLLGMLFPSSLRVMRVVNVAAPREKTLAAVSDLRAWTQWNTFVRSTQLTNKTWSDPSGGAGAWMRSDQFTIRETLADTAGIELNWDLKGGKQYAGGIGVFQTFPDSVTVQWWFDLHFRWYPWEKLGIFVYDRKLGPAMEESLTGLKQYVENSH
jgi:Polyketide cyclase / dehydrase and lipid transport